MEERNLQIFEAPKYRKFYYPSLGIFRDILGEQSFTKETDAVIYEKMLKDHQWNIGGINVIYVDDILITKHPHLRLAAKTNGYYRFEYDYSGDWNIYPLDLKKIVQDKEESIKELQKSIDEIKEHPLYNVPVGTNPIYNPPNREQSNPLA